MAAESRSAHRKTGARGLGLTTCNNDSPPALDVAHDLQSALFLLHGGRARPLNPAAGRLVAVLASGGPLARAVRAAAGGGRPLDYYGPNGDAPDAPHVLAHGRPFEQHGIEGAVLVEIVDASAAFAVETRLRRQIDTDSLTGVASRQRFLAEAARMVAEARRHGHGLGLLMLDLDRFKAINDRHGHGVGDRVLVAACSAWSGLLRRNDAIGRLGGEEFAVLLSHARAAGTRRTAERLRRGLDALRKRLALHDPVTVSVGGAVLRPDDAEVEDLLRRADDALYAAKSGGRNRALLHEDGIGLPRLPA